ncbi:alcohol dehydrogenase catalytic domain-containing protein [uncultured Anaerotruncus sp.]|uniref:alcohol dehydrogenase catalytic domain-containing protein n=1 Tax=uncultured Anaerotruncus sp. TaxID=905011 RepID=UPI00280C25F2|nr:alcohol dehydrogenase catalytic domain-containing protein [uncultured Anaerotruncus sp.]
MGKMKGVAFLGNGKLEIREYDIPAPKENEVLVKVKASCICRSDMNLYHDTKESPYIPGHEPAGVVEAVGGSVSSVAPGDRVAVYLAVGCGHCEFCQSGYVMQCPEFKCIGFQQDGGDAEYIVVPQECCLKIPDSMSFLEAATSTDAFGGLYAAQKKMGVSGSDTVAIFGIGPMGGAGVLAAKARGAFVIACDAVELRLEKAKELGADVCINVTKEDAVAKIRELTGGKGADVCMDLSGTEKGQVAALEATRVMGRMGFMGENHKATIDPREHIIGKQLHVFGNWYFPLFLYPEILHVIESRKVPLAKLVSHTFKLEEAEKAFKMFDNHETEKVVFLMD